MSQLPADALQRLLRYVYSGEVDKADFRRKVRRIRDFKLQDTTMTLEQQFREEGKLEGKRESLLTTLESRFGALPQRLTEEIQKINGPTFLDRLFLQALGCASLEEFSRAL
jgi:hypothetical protein